MLYIVGTPLGNLEDLSIRQAKTIANADILLSEDTRSSGLLLIKIETLFGFKKNQALRHVSFYKETEFQRLPQILSDLKIGKNVVLISSAGMPIISDPGLLLIKHVIKNNIPFTVIPGPTAYTTALLFSGFETNPHMFLGFLPKKKIELKKMFQRISSIKTISPDLVFIAYESPNRIKNTLQVLDESLPDINLAVCRELTKKFEEIARGKPKDLINKLFKGEIVIVIS